MTDNYKGPTVAKPTELPPPPPAKAATERVMIYHDRENCRLEIVRSGPQTASGTFNDWVKGLPGDCGVIYSESTGEIIGIRMAVAADAVIVSPIIGGAQ